MEQELKQLIQDLDSAPIQTDIGTNARYRSVRGHVGFCFVWLTDELDYGYRVYTFVSNGEVFSTENPKTALAFLKEHVS